MTDYIATDTDLTAVANAIRTKGGTSASLEWPSGFSSAIAAIPTGITPTGTVSITSNGTHDVTSYATADVAVPLTLGTIRPDAELVKTVTYDKKLLEDSVISSWPSYSTSAQTLVAAGDVGTYQCDLDTYNYSVLLFMLCKPTYNTATNAKGRLEYWMGSYLYDLCDIPANSFVAASGKQYASRNIVFSGNATGREFYWTSGSAVNVYSTASVGIYMTATVPTIAADGLLTLKSPAIAVKGSGTYFSSTYFGAVTELRCQYILKVYRAPKGNMNLDGWMATMMAKHVMDCINNNSGTLE